MRFTKILLGMSWATLVFLFYMLGRGIQVYSLSEIQCNYPEYDGCYINTYSKISNGDFSIDYDSDGFADYFSNNGYGTPTLIDGIQYVENTLGTTNNYLTYNVSFTLDAGSYIYYSFDYYEDTSLVGTKLRIRYIDNTNEYPEYYVDDSGHYEGIFQLTKDSEYIWFHDQSSVLGNIFGIDNFIVFDLQPFIDAGYTIDTIEDFNRLLDRADLFYNQTGELRDKTSYFNEIRLQVPCDYVAETEDCLDPLNFGEFVYNEVTGFWQKIIDLINKWK